MSYPPPTWPTIRWSASSLRQLLRGCSAQFMFQRLLAQEPDQVSAAMRLGTAVHAAHEHARRHQMVGSPVVVADLIETFDASWADACEAEHLTFPKGKDQESLGEQGRGLVQLMAENLGDDEVLGAEQSFEVEIRLPNGQRRTLVGFFDVVVSDENGNVVVIDLKTSGTAYGESRVADDLQATCYAYAAKQIYGEDVRIAFAVLVKTKTPRYQEVSVFRDKTDFARLARLIQTAETMLGAGIVFPNPTWMCGGCGYRSACDEWGRRLPIAG